MPAGLGREVAHIAFDSADLSEVAKATAFEPVPIGGKTPIERRNKLIGILVKAYANVLRSFPGESALTRLEVRTFNARTPDERALLALWHFLDDLPTYTAWINDVELQMINVYRGRLQDAIEAQAKGDRQGWETTRKVRFHPTSLGIPSIREIGLEDTVNGVLYDNCLQRTGLAVWHFYQGVVSAIESDDYLKQPKKWTPPV